MPGVKDLPVRPELPDVMTMNDGTKVKTVAQWKKRREEIKKILEYYAVGPCLRRRAMLRARRCKSELVIDGKVKYRLVKLTFGPDRKLEL